MRIASSIAVGSLVATLILLGTAVGEEVFVTDIGLTGFAEPPVDEAYSTKDVADCCDLDNLCCGPVWTVTAGTLIMDRSTPDDTVLMTDSFQPGGNVLLDAGEFDFDFRGGWELGAIRHNVRCTCWDMEARYARIDGWRAVRDFVFSPYGSVVHYRDPVGNTDYPTLVGAVYESHFDGLELNLRRPIGCGALTLLGGFRFAELDERGVTILQDIGPGLNLATHRVGAINDLYGFQLGADGCLWQWCCLSLDGKLRAGIYSNRAVNSVLITQEVAEDLASRATDTNTAFLGELGLTGTCQLREGVALRAGYQLMWLEGVAVAADQVAVSDPGTGTATVDADGGVLYHGAVISLEFSR